MRHTGDALEHEVRWGRVCKCMECATARKQRRDNDQRGLHIQTEGMAGPSLPPKQEEEQRYTLDEARLELNRKECAERGHSYEIVVEFGKNEPSRIYCYRCGLAWGVVPNSN